MEVNMKDGKKILIATFIFFSFILLLIGGSYAFLSYTGIGIISSSVSASDIKFTYTEGSNSLSLTEAMPMSDETGKLQDSYFEFDIAAKTGTNIEIPYDITIKKSSTSSDIGDVIKIYLTEVVPEDELVYWAANYYKNVSLSVCEELLNLHSEEENASCIKMYDNGYITDHDLYAIKIRTSHTNLTLDQCQAYMDLDNIVECVLEDDSYSLYSYDDLYDTEEQCTNMLSLFSDEDNASCVVLYESGYQFEEDKYMLKSYLTTEFSDIEECQSYMNLPEGYLTCEEKGTVNGEKELLLTTFDELDIYQANTKDSLLFSSVIAANSNGSTKYRIRIWIDEDIDFMQSKYNNATFSSFINVYANGSVK